MFALMLYLSQNINIRTVTCVVYICILTYIHIQQKKFFPESIPIIISGLVFVQYNVYYGLFVQKNTSVGLRLQLVIYDTLHHRVSFLRK